ncbi:hypothetical protein Ahia01_000304300, partial [Argonauta hians]
MISYHQNVNIPFTQIIRLDYSNVTKVFSRVDACLEWLRNEQAYSEQPFGLVAANFCASAIVQLSEEETSPEFEDLLEDKAQVSMQTIIQVILALKD